MLIDIDGTGEVEAVATAYTLVIYEQAFDGADIIADVFGKHKIDDSGELTLDFTKDNWNAEMKALWAMVRTAYELRADRGDAAPNERPPAYERWARSLGKVNVRDISVRVISELADGFFHVGAADPEKQTGK